MRALYNIMYGTLHHNKTPATNICCSNEKRFVSIKGTKVYRRQKMTALSVRAETTLYRYQLL